LFPLQLIINVYANYNMHQTIFKLGTVSMEIFILTS